MGAAGSLSIGDTGTHVRMLLTAMALKGTAADSTQNTDANAQTGDEFNMGRLLAVMALAGAAAAGTVVIRRRNG